MIRSFLFFALFSVSFPLFAEEVVEVKGSACELHAKVDEIAQSANNSQASHTVFVLVRLACNTGGIAYGYFQFADTLLEQALALGLLGGMMSAVQQHFHKNLTQWQTHRGALRIDKEKKASLLEYTIKEYALHVLYLGALQALKAKFGLASVYISAQVFETAVLSLFSDGFLNVVNYKLTDNRIDSLKQKLMETAGTRELEMEDFENLRRSIARTWAFSKAAAVAISVSATFLAVLDMEGISWAAPAMKTLGLFGVVGTVVAFRKQIVNKICKSRLVGLSRRRMPL